MIGVDVVALGVYFDTCCSPSAPVLGLLVLLVIGVELVHKRLDFSLFLDVQKARLGILSYHSIIVTISLDWWLSASFSA